MQESDIDTGTALEMLSDPLRQDILRYLSSTPAKAVSVESLYGYLQSETEMAEEEIVIRCHHQHLPKLAVSGVIEYDDRMGDVRYHGSELVEGLLREIDDIRGR